MTVWDTERFYMVMRSENVVGVFSSFSEAESVSDALDGARVVTCAEVAPKEG